MKIEMGGGYREKEELSTKNRTRKAAESRKARVAPVEDSGPHTSLRTGSKPVWPCSYTLLCVWHHFTVPITSQEDWKVEYM